MELQNWFVEIWNFLLYVIIVIEGYCNLIVTFQLLSFLLLVRISEICVYMLLYLGLLMDTGLAVISIIRLYDFNISA